MNSRPAEFGKNFEKTCVELEKMRFSIRRHVYATVVSIKQSCSVVSY